MSKRFLRRVAVAAVPLTFGCAVLFAIKSDPQNATVFTTLANVPVLELPEAAAQIVAKSPVAQRSAVLGEVLHAVSALAKPEVTPYAVSAICRATPAVAGQVAQMAVSMQPGDALSITKAAVAAAPGSVEQIVSAVCRQVPQQFTSVAQVAGQESPRAQQEILRGVINALPSMETYVEKAKSYSADGSLASVLRKADELAFTVAQEQAKSGSANTLLAQSVTAQSPMMPVPMFGPPYTPAPTLFTTLTPKDTQIVTPGSGRDYSAP